MDVNMDSEKIMAAKIVLDDLTPAERKQVFLFYCRFCGSNDPGCQCWNDD